MMMDGMLLDQENISETLPGMENTATGAKKKASSVALTIDRAQLLRSLAHVQSVVEKRNTIPILSHVKLETETGVLRLTATDMDIAIVEEVDVAVQKSGVLTVPAQTFYDIIRKLPEGSEVNLEGDTGTGKLFIKSASCNFTLPCLDATDFPAMDRGELSHNFVLPSRDCMALIDKPRFAISTEETRYYLNGIYLHAANADGKAVLRSVATDGHRLARIEVDLPEGATNIPGVIVPRKTVFELKKLLDEGVEQVMVSLSQNKIRFVCGKAILLSKLIDGTFPDYEKVIPKSNDRLLEVDTDFLRQAVDRVSVISSDKLRVIKFSLEKGTLTLSANSQESGDAREVVNVPYDGQGLEIGFNSRYMLEMLSQLEGEVVQFLFANGTAPALVKDTANLGALYVVMPMRV
ncbi:MAG: dnaN [Rickettsiales bacterium]|nr:dnaN [Rickettsiales bacterium]